MDVLTHFPPKSRLRELAGRFGGLTREEAVAAATKELEILRPESDKAILAAIAQLESSVGAARQGDADLMKTLLPLCDQVVNLAGAFGHIALDKATRSLCDLLDGLLTQGEADLASIKVHVQTIRMLAPGAKALGDEHIEVMLAELRRLLDFHGYASLGNAQDSDDASALE